MNKKLSLFSLIAMLAIIIIGSQSCKRNYVQTPGRVTPYDNSKKVVASLSGIILDESGAPLEGASVSVGTNFANSDVNGYFTFTNISMPEHNTTVKVSKQTYFTGYRSVMISANQRHTIKMSLMKKENPQSFVAANGGAVNFNGGLSITFQANSLVSKANGAAYSGQVYVYAKVIDPTTSMGINTMPGALRGLDEANGEEKVLKSYGMLVAEMYDQNGNELQLVPTREAAIAMDVPASLQASASAKIPMWYFDDVKEIWMEEGSANLVGGKYVGTVKHFSYWNFDLQAQAIMLEMILVDGLGNPIPNAYVSLHNAANAGAHGYSNSNGWIGGMAEANAILTLNVYLTALCGTSAPIYTQTVTTQNTNINLGTITVAYPAVSNVSGVIWDCSNNPISNGTILINPGFILVNANSLGQFNYSFSCTPTTPITITAYDNASGTYGNTSSPISLATGANNLGSFAACGNTIRFLAVSMTNTFNNTTTNYTFSEPNTLPGCNVTSSNSNIYAEDSTNLPRYLNFVADGLTSGTFPMSSLSIGGITNASWTDTQWLLSATSTNTVTYTSFPGFPNDVLGSYTATLIGQPSGNSYTITGTFRAERAN